MEYKILGKTGLRVSRIGFGGIPVQRVSLEGGVEAVQAAIHAGMNFIDTARMYSVSESYIGNAIGNLRSKVILATKCPNVDREGMKKGIETSLNELRTDHIELYQAHNVKTKADVDKIFSAEGACAAIDEAIKDGKVGFFGITSHLIEVLDYAIQNYSDKIATVMYPFNIVENQGQEMFKRAKAANIGTIAMKPLGGGNIENIELALRYIGEKDFIDVIIPGIGNATEARQNAIDLKPLTQAEHSECERIAKELGSEFCRRCGYCLPCPNGIDIPTNFTFVNYLEKYNLRDWAKERYAAMKAKAADCASCGICETRCPYGIKIREKLKKVACAFRN